MDAIDWKLIVAILGALGGIGTYVNRARLIPRKAESISVETLTRTIQAQNVYIAALEARVKDCEDRLKRAGLE